jgi:hypothetical protein
VRNIQELISPGETIRSHVDSAISHQIILKMGVVNVNILHKTASRATA